MNLLLCMHKAVGSIPSRKGEGERCVCVCVWGGKTTSTHNRRDQKHTVVFFGYVNVMAKLCKCLVYICFHSVTFKLVMSFYKGILLR